VINCHEIFIHHAYNVIILQFKKLPTKHYILVDDLFNIIPDFTIIHWHFQAQVLLSAILLLPICGNEKQRTRSRFDSTSLIGMPNLVKPGQMIKELILGATHTCTNTLHRWTHTVTSSGKNSGAQFHNFCKIIGIMHIGHYMVRTVISDCEWSIRQFRPKQRPEFLQETGLISVIFTQLRTAKREIAW
jgi:hypothetical protein